jgi:hypothetical protein
LYSNGKRAFVIKGLDTGNLRSESYAIKIFPQSNRNAVASHIKRVGVANSSHGMIDKAEQTESFFSIACLFDIFLYLTSLGQARQFIETCNT